MSDSQVSKQSEDLQEYSCWQHTNGMRLDHFAQSTELAHHLLAHLHVLEHARISVTTIAKSHFVRGNFRYSFNFRYFREQLVTRK